jgi:hypothetical protein
MPVRKRADSAKRLQAHVQIDVVFLVSAKLDSRSISRQRKVGETKSQD